MNNIDEKLTANEVICNLLTEQVKENPNLVTVTSDSRGSAGLVPFTTKFPNHAIEMGIAEQNAVTVAAGLAHESFSPFVFSPAAFLTMRSIEQIKVDVCYSNTNVKLIGISGGNSYCDLGNTHHSLQDTAITRALNNLEVFQPCDKYQVKALFNYLIKSNKPAYVRIGKRKLDNVYSNDILNFIPGKAKIIKNGTDVCLISTGELLYNTLIAAKRLEKLGINTCVVDLVSIKPLDTNLLNKLAEEIPYFVTIEEHSIINGIGSAVAEVIASHKKATLKILGFPDEPAIAGKQDEVFKFYGLDSDGIAKSVVNFIKE